MYGDIQYGILKYSQDSPNDEEIKPYIPELMAYLPSYYNKNQSMMKDIQNAIAQEAGRANYSSVDMLDQFFLDTATWGLDIWERELGVETDASSVNETRRESIKAKLRGSGTITKEMLKNTALAFTNAEIEIIENYEDYSFIIKFIGVKGIPSNMQAFIDMVEAIKPAHLAYSFQYTFSWWDNIKDLTWNNANTYTWNTIREY